MQKLEGTKANVDGSIGTPNVKPSNENFDPIKSAVNSEQVPLKHNADMPKVVSEREMKKTIEDLDKTKFDKSWGKVEESQIGVIQRGSSSFKNLDGSLRSEKKTLNKKMATLSGEHNSEIE